MKKLNSAGRVDGFILAIIGFTAIVIVGGVLYAFSSSGADEKLPQYSKDSAEKPVIKIETKQLNFGNMKLSDEKTEEIALENNGLAPLQLTNVSTSCNCTFAQFVINGKESPRFEMHNNPAWVGTIEPGGKAVLRIIYIPSIMPVQGKVDRTIFFITNDPAEPKVEINFTANVD